MNSSTIDRGEITGLILAGGRGQRMGGVDKGLQSVNGQTLTALAIERLSPQVHTLLINANRNLDEYRRRFGLPVCADASLDYAGPLAGFLAGMRHCKTAWMVTVACDTPRFPLDLVERLASGVGSNAAAIVVTPESGRWQRQPVFCLVRVDRADDLTAYLEEGGRKIDAWLEQVGCAAVEFDEPTAFFNANTVDELRQLGPG